MGKEKESKRKDYESETCWKWYNHIFRNHSTIFSSLSMAFQAKSHSKPRFTLLLRDFLLFIVCFFVKTIYRKKAFPSLFLFFLAYFHNLNKSKRMSHFRWVYTDSLHFGGKNISIWMSFQNQIQILCYNLLWRFSFTCYTLNNNLKGLHF